MKILFCDLQYDYGFPERGISTIGYYGFFRCFQDLGHVVIPFYYDKYVHGEDRNAKIERMQTDLLEAVETHKPDLIYYSFFTDEFRFETLEKIHRLAPSFSWFVDDQWRFDAHTKKYLPYLSWAVTTDPLAIDKYKACGFENVILSQMGGLDGVVEEGQLHERRYDYDVSFVGISNKPRRWFISELEKRGIRVECFGQEWPNGRVDTFKMGEIFRRSKINLNLSNSKTHDVRFLWSRFKNIKFYLQEKKDVSQIKGRNFEIPYWGGFQLADFVPFLDRWLTIGQDIVCYASVDEAAALIKHYLKHDDEREKIRESGVARARREHGYIHRHRDILGRIEAATKKR